MRKIAVLGPGLIGGSILLAARGRLPAATRLAVWSRAPAERAEVLRRGLADEAPDTLADAVRDASLVVLCTPVGALAALADEFAPHLAPEAVVTDVGSVKAPIVAALGGRFPDAAGRGRFVGGHPMAGRERGGLDAARADLFDGAVCLLTPEPRTAPEAVERVGAFWRALGAGRLHRLSAAEHDEAMALVSHLPHLLAGALLEVAAAREGALACSGPGFRDLTRPAGGPAELWTEILMLNRPAVKSALLAMIAQLETLAACLEPKNEAALAAFLNTAASRRAQLPSAAAPPGA